MHSLRRFHFLCWCLSCASASSSSTAAQDVEFTLVPAGGPNAQPEQLRIEHSASRLTLHVPTPIDKSGSY